MFVELKQPVPTKAKTVTYLGAEIEIPANHDWVAVVMMGKAGNHTCLLASFGTKPAVSETGLQWVPVDEDFQILGQVAHVAAPELLNTLRQVDNIEDPRQVLLQNTEELVIKLKHILSSGAGVEEILHAIYCPEHGTFTQFMDHSVDAISDFFPDEDEEKEMSAGAPEEIRDVLAGVLGQIFGQAPQEAEAQVKPRVRVIHAKSLEEALAKFAAEDDIPTGSA